MIVRRVAAAQTGVVRSARRVLSFFALVFALMSGLSVVKDLPSVSQDQVPASPERPSRPALDLDEEESFRGEGEEVDFVDAPVVGDELEVAPSAVGLMSGKPRPHEFERLAFPRVCRLRGLDPVPPGFNLGMAAEFRRE
jgi:hypothetical protein